MSEPERPSEETNTELIAKEAPPETLEISEGARTAALPPAPEQPTAHALPPPPAAAPPPAPQPAPLPQPPAAAPYSPAGNPEPTTPSPSGYPEPTTPPTAAFVPPELLARRRAAAPPSTPYQPIAGWSLAPSAPMPPAPGPGTGGQPIQPPPVAGPTAAEAPSRSIQAARAARAQQPPAGPANGFAEPSRGGSAPAPRRPGSPADPSRRPGLLLAVAAAVVVVGLVIAGVIWKQGQPDDAPARDAKPAPTAPATVAPVASQFTVSSFAPKGSGFREKGSSWQTSTYTTPTFGNLKDGVGLVLDLGSAKEVTAVSFEAETGPLTVELRASNQQPVGESIGERVGDSALASGQIALDGSKGGKHQYWMIWVTKLGRENKAVIGDISVAAK